MTELEHWTPPTRPAPSLADMAAIARELAGADFLPPQFKDKPANILWAGLQGAELGLSPTVAMQYIVVINNRPTITAEGMRALVFRAGHRFRVLESTDDVCTVEIVRRDDRRHEHVETMTMRQAAQAGDAKKAMYQKFPKRMLLARATSNAVTAACPEVLMGVSYTTEDVSSWDDGQVADPDEPENVGTATASSADGAGDSGSAATWLDDGEPTRPVALVPTSHADAISRPKLRGEIRAAIDALEVDQKARLRAWMNDRGWRIDALELGELRALRAYIVGPLAAMLPPDQVSDEVDPR